MAHDKATKDANERAAASDQRAHAAFKEAKPTMHAENVYMQNAFRNGLAPVEGLANDVQGEFYKMGFDIAKRYPPRHAMEMLLNARKDAVMGTMQNTKAFFAQPKGTLDDGTSSFEVADPKRADLSAVKEDPNCHTSYTVLDAVCREAHSNLFDLLVSNMSDAERAAAVFTVTRHGRQMDVNLDEYRKSSLAPVTVKAYGEIEGIRILYESQGKVIDETDRRRRAVLTSCSGASC